MIYRIEKSKCTGCKMCADVCHGHAISYQTDNKGFWYPVVDESKCSSCGLCVEKCPTNNAHLLSEQLCEVYSAWSKEDEVRLTSTSGGVFFELARRMIENKGVVVGCSYCDDFKSAQHIIVDTIEDLEKIKGSKYFQSDTSNIYMRTKDYLDDGKQVLFSGTPCQVAALRNYLGCEYPNLICVDFICRSINSPQAFSDYITELEEIYDSKVIKVHLKNKDLGWTSLASKVYFSNEKVSLKTKNEDWWVKGFLNGDLYTRESCYECSYRTLPRSTADITLGDFWGIKGQSEEDMKKGISVVIVNSTKGKELLFECVDRCVVRESLIQDVLPGNRALLESPIKSSRQDKFVEYMKRNSFSKSVQKSLEVSLTQRMKNCMNKIKKVYYLLKKIRVFKFIYYNFMCKNIKREKGVYLIPYHNAILDIASTARIYIKGRNLEIGHNKLRRSKSETHVRLDENSIWKCNNGCMLFYNTVLELKENACFETGFFTANGGSVIIVDKHISFGDDVMIGRNVIIYDSDFHQLRNQYSQPTNPPKDVYIGDHVWLTSNITVLKGVTIGRDSLVTAQTVVNNDIPEHCIVAGKGTGRVIKDTVNWSRQRVKKDDN